MEKELKTGRTVRQQCRTKGPTPVKKRNEGRNEKVEEGKKKGRREGGKILDCSTVLRKFGQSVGSLQAKVIWPRGPRISQEWTCPCCRCHAKSLAGGISEHSFLQEIWEMHVQATIAAPKPFRSDELDEQNLEMSYLSDEEIHRWRPFVNCRIHSQYSNYHLLSSTKEFSILSPCLYICDLIAQVLWNSLFSESPLAHEYTMYQNLWSEKYGYCIYIIKSKFS